MSEKISERDKKALKLGAIGIVAIVLFLFVSAWAQRWVSVRKSLAQANEQLDSINLSTPRKEAILSTVPVFEMPQKQQKQKLLFRDNLSEQLKKAGLQSEPIKILSPMKIPNSSYKLLRLTCKAKGQFTQVLDLLADLKSNPYLVGIDELNFKCDEKNRQQVELDLTVTTFVR